MDVYTRTCMCVSFKSGITCSTPYVGGLVDSGSNSGSASTATSPVGSPRNSMVATPITIKRSSRGFGLELKSIKVFIGESNDYRLHHIIKVSLQEPRYHVPTHLHCGFCISIVSGQSWACGTGWSEARVPRDSYQWRGNCAERCMVLDVFNGTC